MTETLNYTGQLVVTTCWCGMRQAIPSELMRMAEHTGTAVYCPVGHTWVVKETEADRLKKQLARQKEITGFAYASNTSLRDQLASAERSRAALKGHLTRARNRIANGVCPVGNCRRHFDNVQAHIASEHPEWHVTDPETGKAAVL
ncbi:MAG: hypothetical protein WED09_07375 [Homoserinimonas sp.]